jgi:hypothetical protein
MALPFTPQGFYSFPLLRISERAVFNQAKKYYIELNETRLDPIGLKYYPTKPQEVAGKRPVRVVFFGDSRAASWTAPKVNGYEFINRGISSQTSIQTIQ